MSFQLRQIPLTISIIVACVLVFFVTGSFDEDDAGRFLGCVKRNAPSCLVARSERDYIRCLSPERARSPELCLYDVDETCLSESPRASVCIPASAVLRSQLSFPADDVGAGRRLAGAVTYMFVHADSAHLIGNMVSLFLAGAYVELRMSRFRYLLIYVGSGIASAFAFLLMNAAANSLIGASGAIFGLLAANLVLNFHRPAAREAVAPVPTLKTGYIVTIVALQFIYLASGMETGVAYSGHVGGFVAGLLLAIALRPRNLVYNPQPIA